MFATGSLGRRTFGPAIEDLITIVHLQTFARWVNGAKKGTAPRKPGRPRTPETIRELVIRMAQENGWGLGRILGKLKKLGIRKISKSTVRNILKEHGFDPGPKRGKGSWDEFIKMHAKTLSACDFLSVKAWTLGGLVEYFVLFFIQPGTRRHLPLPPWENGILISRRAKWCPVAEAIGAIRHDDRALGIDPRERLLRGYDPGRVSRSSCRAG